jgi:hypothetical protein
MVVINSSVVSFHHLLLAAIRQQIISWVCVFSSDETAQKRDEISVKTALLNQARVGARQLTYIETIALTTRADLARGPGTPRSYVAT